MKLDKMEPLRYSWLLGVLLLVQIKGFYAANTWKTKIFVSPAGTLLPSCGSAVNPCKTLDLALQTANDRGMNFTRIILKNGNYKLKKTYTFTSAESVSLVGETGQVPIRCSSNVSLTFLLSQNIELHNLKFTECGGWQKSLVGSKSSSGELRYMEYITGLYFSHVKNLHMSNVEVSGSYGVGLTLNDVAGTINITGSSFVNNSPKDRVQNQTRATRPKENRRAHTGGGIFLLLNSYGYNPLNITSQTHDTYQHNNKYLFTDLVFRGNAAESPGFQVTMNTPLVPFSRGGGLGIYLFGNASGNTFTISRCLFVGNKAQWGGGLQVEFKHSTQSNTIRVQQSTFKENNASFAGGGARFGDLTISQQALQPNTFHFDDCLFVNNTSIWGGGSSMYGTTFMGQVSASNTRDKFVLNNCSWRENKGNVGSAIGIFLFNLNDDNIGPYLAVHVVLENCTVMNNEVITQEEDVLIGQAAVYTVEVPIIFKGNNSIANNTNTGMVLDSAMAVIGGQVHFHGNKGYSGGALALYGNSRVRFTNKSRLVFLGNECVEKGGAMYINAPGPPQVSFVATGYSTHQCFFDYEEQYVDYDKWETEIVFQDNRAPNEESGLSVYATSLQNCRRAGEKRKNNTVLQWRIVTFLDASGKNRTSVNREVSTDPVDIGYEKADWNVAASEPFNASVKLLDEKNNPVVGMVDISTSKDDSSANVQLSTASSLFLVNNKSIQRLSLAGREGDTFKVTLRSIGGHQLQRVIRNLTLKACNPGFHSQGDKCVCSDTILRGISRCGDDSKSVYLKRGYWAGMVDGHFQTAPCPVNYCTCPDQYGSNLVGECTYIESQMCSGNRDSSSIVCGRCKPGYTSAFLSAECIEECSYYNLLYFIPIFLGLFLLVLIAMVINVGVFTGYVNTWLYSYQVILLITPRTYSFDEVMTFVIGLANLELRVKGICLINGIDEADELFIAFGIPVVTFILVAVVYCVSSICKLKCRCSKWYTKKVKNPFSVFCIFYDMCYTSITRISLRILEPISVGDKMHLYLQGEVIFFQDTKHIVYGIFAIAFLLIIVPPIPVLIIVHICTECINICRQCINKCRRCINNAHDTSTNADDASTNADDASTNADDASTNAHHASTNAHHASTNAGTPCINKCLPGLQQLFNKLQAWYNKLQGQYPGCGAFYFLSRLLILLLDTYMTRSPLKRACLEGACVLILTFFVYLRPYKKGNAGENDYHWMNISDAILLSNLTIISISSSVIEESPSKSVREGVGVFINILAYVPLLILGYILREAIKAYLKKRKRMGEEADPSNVRKASKCMKFLQILLCIQCGSEDGQQADAGRANRGYELE